jgi:hypothetical protein
LCLKNGAVGEIGKCPGTAESIKSFSKMQDLCFCDGSVKTSNFVQAELFDHRTGVSSWKLCFGSISLIKSGKVTVISELFHQ